MKNREKNVALVASGIILGARLMVEVACRQSRFSEDS